MQPDPIGQQCPPGQQCHPSVQGTPLQHGRFVGSVHPGPHGCELGGAHLGLLSFLSFFLSFFLLFLPLSFLPFFPFLSFFLLPFPLAQSAVRASSEPTPPTAAAITRRREP